MPFDITTARLISNSQRTGKFDINTAKPVPPQPSIIPGLPPGYNIPQIEQEIGERGSAIRSMGQDIGKIGQAFRTGQAGNDPLLFLRPLAKLPFAAVEELQAPFTAGTLGIRERKPIGQIAKDIGGAMTGQRPTTYEDVIKTFQSPQFLQQHPTSAGFIRGAGGLVASLVTPGVGKIYNEMGEALTPLTSAITGALKGPAQKMLGAAASFLTQKVPSKVVQSTLNLYNKGMKVLDPKWMTDFVKVMEERFAPIKAKILNTTSKVNRTTVLENLSKVTTGKRGQALQGIVDSSGKLTSNWELDMAGAPEREKKIIKELVSKLLGKEKPVVIGGVTLTPDKAAAFIEKAGAQNVEVLKAAGLVPSETVALKDLYEVHKIAGSKLGGLPNVEGYTPHSGFVRSLSRIYAATDDALAKAYPDVWAGIKQYAEDSAIRSIPKHFEGGHLSFFRVIFPRIALMGMGLPAAAASMASIPLSMPNAWKKAIIAGYGLAQSKIPGLVTAEEIRRHYLGNFAHEQIRGR